MLSRYTDFAKLGQGGMGVVYRATDRELHRPVALKFVTARFGTEDQARVRFLREARMAAALNHPAICTIYEVAEVQPGEERSLGPEQPLAPGTPFIAMELIEGKTLDAVLRERRRFGRDDLLDVAIPIAEALATAHAKGIVHRDLKPANIMVLADGRPKILDFGLAKVVEPGRGASSEAASRLTTVSDEMSQAGRVMGTAPYMSPEQIRGQDVDARSDLFAFGIVLHEVVTGKRPFDGATSMDVMMAILREAPPPPSESNTEAPPELDRIVAKCLEKAPGDRYQDTRDLAVDLRRLKKDTTSGAERRTSIPASRRGLRALSLLGGAAVIAVGVWAYGSRGCAPVPRPAVVDRGAAPFQQMKMTRLLSSDELGSGSSVMSPDGRYLAYSLWKNGKASLWIKQIATGSDIEVLSPQADFRGRVRFSPDGNYIYYGVEDRETKFYRVLYRVPTLGGTPHKVLFDVDSPVSFSPDGRQLAFLRGVSGRGETNLMIANADGSEERRLAVKKGVDLPEDNAVSWSPDGQRIAAAVTDRTGDAFGVDEFSIGDGKEKRITNSPWETIGRLVWLPDGRGLVMTAATPGMEGQQLWIISYPDGTPRRITNDSDNYAEVSVSADGKAIVTSKTRRAARLWVAPVDGTGEPREVMTGSTDDDSISQMAPTPTGGLVFRSRQGGASTLWGIEEHGERPRRLTPEDLQAWSPHVARSTGAIVFNGMNADRIVHAFRADADGEHLTRLTSGKGEAAVAVSPDGGRMLLFRFDDPELFRVALPDGQPVRIPGLYRGSREFSPDGRELLIGEPKEENGRSQWVLKVIPAEDGAPLRIIRKPESSTFTFHWSPTGDAVTYVRDVDGVSNVWSQPLAGGEPKPITHFKTDRIWEHAFSIDGKHVFALRGQEHIDVVLVTNFL